MKDDLTSYMGRDRDRPMGLGPELYIL
jgi:hypothetical protein